VLEIDKGIRRPELLLEPFAGNDLTRMFEKEFQDLEWLRA